MKKWMFSIRADTNDGDYVTEECDATEADSKKLIALLERVKWGQGHNFETQDQGDCQEEYDYTDEEWDFLMDYIPSSDYGIHTIERVERYQNIERQRIF